MKLSTLIELSHILKTHTINESYKPINEAYNSDLFTKYAKLFERNHYNNRIILTQHSTLQEAKLNGIVLESLRNFLYKGNNNIDNYIGNLLFDNDDLSDELKIELINDKGNEFVFNKNEVGLEFINDRFDTNFKTFNDALQFINKIIVKYDLKWNEVMKELNAFATTKFSHFENSNFKKINLKEARSSLHKNSWLFWEDTNGELFAISYNNSIVMYIPTSMQYKHSAYIIDPYKNTDKPFSLIGIEEYLNNSSGYKYYRHGIKNYILNQFNSYLIDEYTIKYTTPTCILDLKDIKNHLNTISTIVFTDNTKRTIKDIPEIGAIYALSNDDYNQYRMTDELKTRDANNYFYNSAEQRLESLKKHRDTLVTLAKKCKEYISEVSEFDSALDKMFEMLTLITEFLKQHLDDKWLTFNINTNIPSTSNNYISYINDLLETLQKAIGYALKALEYISSMESHADMSVMRKDYITFQNLQIAILNVIYDYNSKVSSLTNNSGYIKVWSMMVENEPELFKGYEQIPQFQRLKP